MSSERSDDAIGFFSKNAELFHGLYRASQPEFLERVQIWGALLDRYATPGGSALDMGCGPGVFTFYLSQRVGSVVGIDGASEMLQRCEAQRRELKADNVRFVQARLPLEREADFEPADLLISSSVVEYVDDLDGILAQFSRLLKPGGALIISLPNLASLSRCFQRVKFKLTGEPEIYRHIKHFSLPLLLQLRLKQHGLSYAEAGYYTHVTRIAKLGRTLGWPLILTEDLFVAAFRKT
jgi:SAM-dependent methyltransferase